MPRSETQSPLGNTSESARLPWLTMSPNKEPAGLRVLVLAVFLGTVGAVLFARIRLLGLPLERDEGEYAYTGQLILGGIPPYQLAYSMKFPGTAAAYALLMSIFGKSTSGVHLGLIAVNLMTVALIFDVGRNLFGEISGMASAAAYSVLSLMPHVLGNAAHATHFVALFSVAGSAVLIGTLNRKSATLIFTSGCLYGLAILVKQPGIFFAGFGTVYLLAHDYRAHLETRETIRRALLFVAGISTPVAITCLILWCAGVFHQFWFWTIHYAGQYGSQVSLSEGVRIFTGHFFGALGTTWPIWTIALVGFVLCIAMRTLRGGAGFLILFTFFSALAVCPGFYFRPHYFILLLPAISLLAGTVVAATRSSTMTFRFAVLALLTVSIFWPLWSEADFFFERPLLQANRMVNGTNPFPESVRIGEYIREQSNPTDRIAVLGSEPQIYFYANRRSASGYIYTYGLMEPQPYAHQMQQEMINEIERAQPKFLVLVVMNKSWLTRGDSDLTIFRWADSYCDANYEEVGLINITDQGTDYYLTGRPPDVTPTADHILIYRRKT